MQLIATTAEIEEGNFITRTLGGLDIVLGKADGRFFAVQDLCPHAFVPISSGWLDGCDLTCPYHGLTFDVHTGECIGWTDIELNKVDIKVEDDNIFLVDQQVD
jgi:3-phenylpropionate/trans-cinnamate dioxygenase ferredoxin component